MFWQLFKNPTGAKNLLLGHVSYKKLGPMDKTQQTN